MDIVLYSQYVEQKVLKKLICNYCIFLTCRSGISIYPRYPRYSTCGWYVI